MLAAPTPPEVTLVSELLGLALVVVVVVLGTWAVRVLAVYWLRHRHDEPLGRVSQRSLERIRRERGTQVPTEYSGAAWRKLDAPGDDPETEDSHE